MILHAFLGFLVAGAITWLGVTMTKSSWKLTKWIWKKIPFSDMFKLMLIVGLCANVYRVYLDNNTKSVN